MEIYAVLRNSKTGQLEAVKEEYSYVAAGLALIQLRWLWAFVKREASS
jgi:hypothetical protein